MEFLNNQNEIFKDVDFNFLDNMIVNTNVATEKKNIKKENTDEYPKILKGKARQKQLNKMTEKEKEKEKIRIKERNRIIAQKYRRNKKKYINTLENNIKEYEKKIIQQHKQIINLNLELEKLKKEHCNLYDNFLYICNT